MGGFVKVGLSSLIAVKLGYNDATGRMIQCGWGWGNSAVGVVTVRYSAVGLGLQCAVQCATVPSERGLRRVGFG